MKPTLHLICGLPGSGKTTFAMKLEKDINAVRFTNDEWMIKLFGHDYSDSIGFTYGHLMSALIRRLYARILEIGIDVILDDGFFTKNERNRTRQYAENKNCNHKLYFTHCSEEVMIQRLQKRNAEPDDKSLTITEKKFLEYIGFFESPRENENPILINTQAEQ